tara:strand:+ start:4335 stop:5915 length:1581 start_codon:yes stop_codon:yes gene_type:complete
MHKKLLKLFAGDNTRYLKSLLTGKDDERGKKGTDYQTIHEPLTSELWQEHLEGKIRIGLKPELEDKCVWGCIDVDPHSYTSFSAKKYVDIIKKYKLPLIAVKSKSGGLHIFVFFTEWADAKKVSRKLSQINEQYFQAQEVFPCNKMLNMPYNDQEATMEHAYDDNNNALLVGRFLKLAEQKKIVPSDFYNYKVKEYDVESEWGHYPPCVQKLIQEGWSGNNRNNYLFNVLVLEMKKNNALTVQQIEDMAQQRNSSIFTTPLGRNEVSSLAKSVHKSGYEFQCPPKHPEFQPICNKDLCKTRRLGIGEAIPEIIDNFENITYIQDPKNTSYTFDFKEQHVIVVPEDMKDEKSFRVKLLRHRIFWMTLPKSRKGPDPFELLMKGIVEKAEENKEHTYEDTLEEERYQALKDFFESHMEQDKFDKLKDGYVILDSKTNFCYFKKITLDRFLKKSGTRIFASTTDAIRLLGCSRKDYHEGEKNVWCVEMPTFVTHRLVKQKIKDKPSEMDDDYHKKFRDSKAKGTAPENH